MIRNKQGVEVCRHFRKIKSDADRQHLQDDLNKLIEWSETV